MSDWVGGQDNNDYNDAKNWTPNGVPAGDDAVTVSAGSTITLTSDETVSSKHGATLTGAGAITIAGPHTLHIDSDFYVTAGETLVLESSTLEDSTGLEIAGHGTFEISGGSFSNSHTLTIGSEQYLELKDTTFSTNSPIIGTGTIGLSGSTLDLPYDDPATAISFSGSNNTLVIPAYNDEGPLENLGFGDTIVTEEKLSLVANKSAGGYELVASISNYTEVVSNDVTLANGVTPSDFINKDGEFYAVGSPPEPAISCFMAGTAILTPDGEVAVEALSPGDLVTLSDGRTAPISWLGRQTISTRFADPLRVLPIRIKAGALGENLPSRDLLISPDHAILIQDILIQAGALVNGVSILRESNVPETFTYYHVEVADHSLILAENTPAETFVDNVDRLGFDNWNEHPAPHANSIAEMDYPRALSTRQVPLALRAALMARAAHIIGDMATAA